MKRARHVPRDTPPPGLGAQVTALLTERAQHVARVAAIDQTLAAVRAALGVGASSRESSPTDDVPYVNFRRPPKATARELAHPNRDQARTEAILSALAHGARSVREIAEDLDQDRLVVKQALQRLAKAGVLTKIGLGNGTKYTQDTAHTEVTPPAPRAVAPPAPSPILRAHPVSKTDLASVEARDQAVLHHLRAHIATLEQIIAALPEESGLDEDQFAAACEASVTRLRAKGLIVRSGRAWTAAVVAGKRASS